VSNPICLPHIFPTGIRAICCHALNVSRIAKSTMSTAYQLMF
jgi:hypothetical protein